MVHVDESAGIHGIGWEGELLGVGAASVVGAAQAIDAEVGDVFEHV